MSNAMVKACWPLKMASSPKFVLMLLADYANDAGECWPSIPTICERTCLGRTAVLNAVKWLEKHGAMHVEHGGGIGHSNRYTLTPSNFVAETSASRTVETSATQTVREANGSSRDHETSASRTGNVRQATPNHQEPSRTIKEGADAPIVNDPEKAMWDAGVALLGNGSRSLLGKLVKENGRESVMQAIASTTAAKAADPKTYFLGVLKNSAPSASTRVEEFRRAI